MCVLDSQENIVQLLWGEASLSASEVPKATGDFARLAIDIEHNILMEFRK